MKNILVFSNHFFPISGTFLHRQIEGAAAGNTVTLAAIKFSNADNFPLPGVRKVKLKSYYGLFDRLVFYLEKKITGTSLKISPGQRTALTKFCISNCIDLIHAHYGTMAVQILPVAQKLKIPLLVSFHGYDATMAVSRKGYDKQLEALFNYASRIIIVSDHMRETLKLSRWEEKVLLIPYGIDVKKFSKIVGTVRGPDVKILHSGRLASKKGVPDLIRVFSKIAEKYDRVSLHILGDGHDEAECKKLVKDYQIGPRVIFYGARPQEDVLRLMNECSIFVLNSRISEKGDMEGLPNAILEAMSMEMAVVSTYHAGIPTAIENGISGLLVPERNNEALLGALERLIEDHALLERLGAQARQRVEQYFTIEEMKRKVNLVYDSIQIQH